jgi:hypothetical protein
MDFGAEIWASRQTLALVFIRTYGFNKWNFVVFEVLMAASVKMTAFWDVLPGCLVAVYQWYGGVFCLHQGSSW